LGISTLLISGLGFVASALRGELVLTLIGAVFLGVLGYCCLGVFVAASLQRGKARFASVQIITKELRVGEPGEVVFFLEGGRSGRRSGKKFFRLPGILIRYKLRLWTRDGRFIEHVFDPDVLPGVLDERVNAFPVQERGAYYSDHDELMILDVPGFFSMGFPVPQAKAVRLLAMPKPAEQLIPVPIRSGGMEQRTEPNFQRTDNLIDHRPYVPGDDPRRINWKLYGHAGDLFVREGEPEPPPHSRLLIALDTQADPLLYTPEAGRRGVDLLCEHALALALEFGERGMDIAFCTIGDADEREAPAGEGPEQFLAYPAASPLGPAADKPFPEDRGVLVLALPRSSAEPSALDGFLGKRAANRLVDIIFLYEGAGKRGKKEDLAGYGETCAALYGQRPGVRARALAPHLI
jgi:uncharacterized protein (DUF58 family)